jgi:hypothetical protein
MDFRLGKRLTELRVHPVTPPPSDWYKFFLAFSGNPSAEFVD